MSHPDMTLVCPVFCTEEGRDFGVVLIRKHKPPWQDGLLNLPGGKIEEGETPARCAARELEEETGLVSAPEDLTYVGKLARCVHGATVYVFVVRFICRSGETWMFKRDSVAVPIDVALKDPTLIHNLRYLIPRALCALDGYTEAAR